MTAAGTFPDEWDEFCLIAIQEKGGSDIEFQAFTEDITAFNWMEKDIQTAPLVNGGRVTKRVSFADPEGITMKVYPVKADEAEGGVVQLFHPLIGGTSDSTQPIVVPNSLKRKLFRIVLLWSEELPDDGTLTATSVPTASNTAYRIQIFNAYMTQYKPSFDDKQFSAEVTFKWAPFQKDATRNKIEESTDGSEQLDAVTAYT
jgi:hypothetical protein